MMKPTLPCLLGVLLLALVAPTRFERVVGGEELDRGVFVSPTSDGGYVAIGSTRSFGEGEEDIYLVRTDASGAVLWSRTYGGPKVEYGWSVHEDGGGLVLAGSSESFGQGAFDCYLVRTDAAGDVQWSKVFGGEGSDLCWSLLPTGGGYVLAGETTSDGQGAEDCFLIRVDASGDELWSATFGGAEGDRCFAVAEAEDGGFLLAGQTYSEGAGDRDVYLVRTDASGAALWTKTFGGAASDVGHGVARTDDGGFLVTGYTTSLASEEDDPYLIKLDAEGRVSWTRVLPMEGINHTITGEQAADGGFFLVGFSEYRTRDATGALLVKTDRAGELQWSRDLFTTATGQSFGYTVRATPDGGAVFTGHTTEGSRGGLDLLLVKVDGEGR